MRRLALVSTVAAVVLAAVLSSCSEPLPDTSTEEETTPDACSPTELLACARDSTLAEYVPDEPTVATGEPIRLGMINQENTPAGSYPELSQAVLAATSFINEEMGGVRGRPIEVEVCNTEFSAEGSTACAQKFVEAKVPAVLGGIDVFGNAIDTLNENGVPFVGGVPVSTQSVQSPNSFQWSGGSWGATVAFAWYAATELDAKKVAIVYGEFGSVTHSAEVGRSVLEDNGVEVQMVPFPILATDITSPLSVAAAFEPDAIFMLASDAGCKAAFDGVASLGIEATMFYVGACAVPSIVAEAGPETTNGAYFNVEGEITPDDEPSPDGDLYDGVVEKYGDGLDPIGAGTVTFRAVMNLFVVLSELDEEITPASIMAALRAQSGAASFNGHDYTCDGEQFEGLPAMCSPQQVLARMHDGTLTQVGDWIDVGRIYRG